MSSREKGSAISRVMQIIDAVATAERPLSPADLACQLAIPKPSIHRLLNQLESDGFIQTNMRGMIVPSAKMHGIAWPIPIHVEQPRCSFLLLHPTCVQRSSGLFAL